MIETRCLKNVLSFIQTTDSSLTKINNLRQVLFKVISAEDFEDQKNLAEEQKQKEMEEKKQR